MADETQAMILRAGAKDWNGWRQYAELGRVDLTGVDMRGKSLVAVNLSAADLSHANLSRADLRGGSLRSAKLTEANLIAADLAGVDMSDADLCRANLSKADLRGTNLSGATVNGANFADSILGATTLAGIDLSTAKGLDATKHSGPSVIDVQTLYLSKGEIPDGFLRGVGVPDEFITHVRSLVVNPIEFYSCFISYSSKDREFAERLYADLQSRKLRCWFAPHDVRGGRKLYEQIDQAIRLHEKLLLILSPHSMNSEWVKTEIARARKREVQEKRQILFPVRLVSFDVIQNWECFDADTGKDSAREIREYFIPDFSNWKDHDTYKETFERLLHDLKSVDPRSNKTE